MIIIMTMLTRFDDWLIQSKIQFLTQWFFSEMGLSLNHIQVLTRHPSTWAIVENWASVSDIDKIILF